MSKLIPHTANALTPSVSNKSGDSEYIAMSQKGVQDLISGDSTPVATFEDAPSDGKFYVRKDGGWVAIEATLAVDDNL